jgi:Tfp pilus assembly protein PilF
MKKNPFIESIEKFSCVLLILCLAVFLMIACEFRKQDSTATVSDAVDALSGKNPDWKKAKTLAAKAVKQDSENPLARIVYALTLEQDGQITSAVDELKKAISISPKNFTAQYSLGRIYFENSKYENCLAPLITANKIESSNANVLFYLAGTYAKLNQPDKAITKFKKLAKLPEFENRPEPFNEIAVILMTKKDYKTAFPYFVAAYKRSPENHKILWNLAVFYDKYTKDTVTAAKFYKKYEEITLINRDLENKRIKARERIKTLLTPRTGTDNG